MCLPRLCARERNTRGAGRGVGAPVVVERKLYFRRNDGDEEDLNDEFMTTMGTRTTREDDERASDLAASRDRGRCKIDWRTRNREIATEMRTITRQREERRTVEIRRGRSNGFEDEYEAQSGGSGRGGNRGWSNNNQQRPRLFPRELDKFLVAGAFVVGIGAGVVFDTSVDLEPSNVASREIIDRRTPSSEVYGKRGIRDGV